MKKIFNKVFVITAILLLLTSSGSIYAEPVLNETSVQNTNVLPSKKQIPRRKLAMKFIMAMLGVGASSIVIYVTLSLYNKLVWGTNEPKYKQTEDNDFKTSTNMKEALNVFLKKTK